MSEKKKDFIKLLEDLCFIYRDYVKKHDNSSLYVIINSNMVKMELYEDRELIDEFGLAFNHKEKNSYMYISIILMKNLFGSKIIYNRDNLLYSDGIDIKFDVMDQDVLDRMFSVMSIYRDVDFYDRIDYGRKIRNKINRDRTAKLLDERINITKRLLKVRDK